ncbi:hypothetical protein PPUJ20066_10510 [Pseudomonas putida]|nr:hypothetical protein PPUJ20066_10510 [Pseudomonas putida]
MTDVFWPKVTLGLAKALRLMTGVLARARGWADCKLIDTSDWSGDAFSESMGILPNRVFF